MHKNDRELFSAPCRSASYQICMILYCLFDLLRFNANVSLCGTCTAMLKKPLHKCYIVAIGIVDLRCVPFAEAVGTDTLVPQVIADNVKLLLHRPFCDRKHKVVPADAVPQTVIFHVLLNNQRDREHTALAGLLLRDFQPVTIPVPDNIT